MRSPTCRPYRACGSRSCASATTTYAPHALNSLRFRENALLDLTGLRLDSAFALPSLTNVRELILRDNFISDVSRLAEFDRPHAPRPVCERRDQHQPR